MGPGMFREKENKLRAWPSSHPLVGDTQPEGKVSTPDSTLPFAEPAYLGPGPSGLQHQEKERPLFTQ